MQTQDNSTETCYRRGNRRIRQKPLRRPPGGKSIHQRISWSTRITKDPPSLVYLMCLSHPSSCYQLASRNLVFSSFPRSQNSAQLHPPIIGFFQCFPTAPEPYFTLRFGAVTVWAINLSRIQRQRGRSRGKPQGNLYMIVSITISNSQVCMLGFSL